MLYFKQQWRQANRLCNKDPLLLPCFFHMEALSIAYLQLHNQVAIGLSARFFKTRLFINFSYATSYSLYRQWQK